MNRTCMGALALITTAGLALGGTASASAAPASKLTKTDVHFLKTNEQVNLAEIALAKIVLKRSHTQHGRGLARMTKRDHEAAKAKVEAVAKKDNVTLPSASSAAQQATATALMHAPMVNHRYFLDQIAGHRMSIHQTKVELRSGSKRNVLHYAAYYLPVAEKHLTMSLEDLARWHRFH